VLLVDAVVAIVGRTVVLVGRRGGGCRDGGRRGPDGRGGRGRVIMLLVTAVVQVPVPPPPLPEALHCLMVAGLVGATPVMLVTRCTGVGDR
jgi:hypothetical protein